MMTMLNKDWGIQNDKIIVLALYSNRKDGKKADLQMRS